MTPFLAAFFLVPLQTEPLRVSVDSRGEDVREVIATLFAQVHRPYALDAAIKGRLYVTLDRMPFPKALNVVLRQASLVARDQDGVTMILPAPKVAVPPPAPVVVKRPSAPPSPPVPAATFARRVTTRLSRAPLAQVFATLGEQAGVEIAVGPSVPPYRVDAYFAKTSLRYALDQVCRAAGLTYAVSGGKIEVSVKH